MSIYFPGTPLSSKVSHVSLRGTLSYAFSRSINTICRSRLFSLYFSISLRKM
ncbi:hypothetical protein Hanom_Chr02g00176541 [Helianthus anomalus]